MTAAVAEAVRANLRPRRRAERSLRAMVFHAVLLLCLLIGLLVLVVLMTDVVRDGARRLNGQFISSLPSRFASRAGVKPAMVGSLWLMGLVAVISLPIGVGAAVYLEEFAPRNRFTRFIELNVLNLSAVPSVIYGLLGLAFFVRMIHLGRTLLAAALTLVLLILPIIIVASREALRAVPPSIREGSLAVGATKWQTTRGQTLPAALPGILTGMILGLSRAIGEAAPILIIGAATYLSFVPSGPLDSFTALPVQIFSWVQRPQPDFHQNAAAGIIILLGILLAMNALAIFTRNRYERRW